MAIEILFTDSPAIMAEKIIRSVNEYYELEFLRLQNRNTDLHNDNMISHDEMVGRNWQLGELIHGLHHAEIKVNQK